MSQVLETALALHTTYFGTSYRPSLICSPARGFYILEDTHFTIQCQVAGDWLSNGIHEQIGWQLGTVRSLGDLKFCPSPVRHHVVPVIGFIIINPFARQ